jgi:UrcA family protein
MKSIKYLLPVAALALSGIAAAGSSDINSVVVQFGDLNLDSQAGVKSLHKRIRNAAESVCSPMSSRILGLRDAYDLCVNEAVRKGIAEVGNSNLTNFHASN